ncbi:bis(5'-nucleosyl)-tetraphosphatase, partial [Patescibacteria group bacterium]
MELKKEKFDEKSCGVVLFRENDGQREYLILHYPSGHWDFPKGHVESIDKTEEETALRELEEESGIKSVELIDGFRERITYSYKRKGVISSKQVIFFIGKTKERKVTLS